MWEVSGHACLIPDLRGEAFSLSPLSTVLAVALSYVTFIMLICAPHQLNQNYFSSRISHWLGSVDAQNCWLISLCSGTAARGCVLPRVETGAVSPCFPSPSLMEWLSPVDRSPKYLCPPTPSPRRCGPREWELVSLQGASCMPPRGWFSPGSFTGKVYPKGSPLMDRCAGLGEEWNGQSAPQNFKCSPSRSLWSRTSASTPLSGIFTTVSCLQVVADGV